MVVGAIAKIADRVPQRLDQVHSCWCTNPRAWRVGGKAQAPTGATAARLNNEHFAHCPRAWPRPWPGTAQGHDFAQRLDAFAGRHGGVSDGQATGRNASSALMPIGVGDWGDGDPGVFSHVGLSAEAVVKSDSRNEAVSLYVDRNARSVVAVAP
jgi:hypothetical protein